MLINPLTYLLTRRSSIMVAHWSRKQTSGSLAISSGSRQNVLKRESDRGESGKRTYRLHGGCKWQTDGRGWRRLERRSTWQWAAAAVNCVCCSLMKFQHTTITHLAVVTHNQHVTGSESSLQTDCHLDFHGKYNTANGWEYYHQCNVLHFHLSNVVFGQFRLQCIKVSTSKAIRLQNSLQTL